MLTRELAAVRQGLADVEAAVAALAAQSVAVSSHPAAEQSRSSSAPAVEQPVATLSGAESFRGLLIAMFEAALLEDRVMCWEKLGALTYSGDLRAPKALDNLKAFSWKKLRTNARRYLEGDHPGSFEVDRTVELAGEGGDERLKVFIRCPGASPAPVTLRRDGEAGGQWRLNQVSL